MIFGCVWSIGATSDTDSRLKFDAFFKELLKGKNAHYPLPELVQKLEFSLPDAGTIYDYFFEMKNRGEWRHWNDLLRSSGEQEKAVKNIRSMIVPTMDTVRTIYLLDYCIKFKRPVLIVGPTGKIFMRSFFCDFYPDILIPMKFPFEVCVLS